MGLHLSKRDGRTVETAVASYLSNSSVIRNMVSKHRRRMLISGYDLDMSYITDRILAMSFPAERMRAVYRNPLWQVKSVLDARHQDHYKVYNLCIEESYDPSHFHDRVERYPFDDNHVPPLHIINMFCESVHSWLLKDPKNVAVVHCMAGKGRTGLMVCAFLVYSGMTSEEALRLYASKRTTNNQGVSIPSQLRYVAYWEKILSFQVPRSVVSDPPGRELRRIRLYDFVNIDAVFFVMSEMQEIPGQLYRPTIEVAKSCCRPVNKENHSGGSHCYYLSFDESLEDDLQSDKQRQVIQMDTESPMIYRKTCIGYYFDQPVQVKGDVRLTFYEKMIGGRLFYVCFNTAFIRNGLLQFSAGEMDKIGAKGRWICGPAFCLELLFGPANSKRSALPLEDECD